jgi:hypothetical protein
MQSSPVATAGAERHAAAIGVIALSCRQAMSCDRHGDQAIAAI